MTTIQQEFDNYIKSIYPHRKLGEGQIRDLKQAFAAGMLTVLAMRKERASESGVEFVDAHIQKLSDEIIEFGRNITIETLGTHYGKSKSNN
jgi:hypothetical protein